MSVLDATLGLIALTALLVVMSLVGLAVHLVVRPRGTPRVRAPDALRNLEPRGGRQRFSVRLLEGGFLAAIYIIGFTVVGLWAAAPAPSGGPRWGAVAFGVCLVVATWWAWRRGVLLGTGRQVPASLKRLGRRRGRA